MLPTDGGDGAAGVAGAPNGGGSGGGAGGAGMYEPIAISILSGPPIVGGKGGAGGKGFQGGAGGGGDGGGGVVSGVLLGGLLGVHLDTVAGGAGGIGGNGAIAGGPAPAGDGGNGGAGVTTAGADIVFETVTTTGGNGGVGSVGGPATNGQGATNPGSGGAGGAGVNASSGGSVLIGSGAITGGNDGMGGNGGSNPNSLGGNGGAGVDAAGDVTVQAGASVTGGNGGMAGGGNTLVLESGYAFNGNVVSDGFGDTLGLGGDHNDNFDLSLIGTTFQNFDTFAKGGSSTWTLTGTSSFSGDTAISGGTLAVNGSLATSAFSIQADGTLGGTGTVGRTTVQSGATIAPGNSIGTLHTGALTLSVGSTYAVEVAPGGTSDNIAVTGGATLVGTVVVTSASGANDFPSTPSQYTILTATGGVTGTFTDLDTTALAFFDGSLDYGTANAVTLTLTRNAVSLTDLAQDGNQMSTAGAIESLGAGNPLYNGILGLGGTQVQSAYQQLSGESLGSADQGQVQLAGLVSTAVVDRINQSFDTPDTAAASNYLPAPDRVTGAFDALDAKQDPTHSIWVSGYGAPMSMQARRMQPARPTAAG